MPLDYETLLELGTKNVVCLAFSTSGSNLAAITSDGTVNLWNMATGRQYYPAPRLSSVQESCISWLDDATFICGFADGSLLTGYLNPDGVDELDIQRVKVSDSAVLEISFNHVTGLLAIGDKDGIVRFWMRARSHWRYVKTLPEAPNFLVEYEKIVLLSWLTDEANNVLVAYKNKGLFVWDIEELVVKRSIKIKSGRKVCKGTLCSSIRKFVAINDRDSVDVYDIHSGESWSPSSLKSVYAVKSIPAGTGFIAGGVGKSELVDIVGTSIGQVFCEDETDTSKVTCIDVHQNDIGGTQALIATASSKVLQIWKMWGNGIVGNGEDGQNRSDHEETSTNSFGLFSFLYGPH